MGSYANTKERDDAIAAIRTAKFKWNGKPIWADADRPLDERLPVSFAFAVKMLMADWEWQSQALYVDKNSGTLYLGEEMMLVSRVEGGTFKISYSDGWEEYLKSDAFTGIVDGLQKKMAKGKGGTKGSGKGKRGKASEAEE